ncbi:MAG: pyrroline-5-carboxylate reductase [Arenicellales bacterium]|nr:pyrroline-5-carboxylate reductase [Arenicellales bacterium]
MQNKNIGFIGGGNMARSLIGGLIDTGHSIDTLYVAEPDPAKRQYFEQQVGIHATEDNSNIMSTCDIIVLAVKPQIIKDVLLPLQPLLQQYRPLILSIAAGVTEKDIDRWAGGSLPIVRAMPNTPALVGSGATGLYANSRVNEEQHDLAESLMRAVGLTVWLENEALLDPVTALSGSGPAYFMLFMEALEQAAIDQGLDSETAHLLVLETCLGAAKLAMESDEELIELRRRVTSPGGTTERALQVMEDGNIKGIIGKALKAASQRASELGRILGEDDG